VLTALIFVGTYATVAAGRAPFLRLGRTGAAVAGAALMVITGAITFRDAVSAVDGRTILLLFGMMIIVAHLKLAGGLAALARVISARVAHPAALVFVLVVVAGALSALFVNDTVCLVFTPIVLDVAAARGHRPLPYLLALATASNIGSAATITGNPQNILIGSVSRISFAQFVASVGPIAVVALAVDAALIWLMFRRELQRVNADAVSVRAVQPHRPLLTKTLAVTAAVLAGFLAGYDIALVAVAGAAVLMLTERVRPEVFASVDWSLLLLFVGLFVVVGAGERAGFDRRLFDLLKPLGIATVGGLSATAAILSNIISNVPAVMLFTKLVPRLPDPGRAWLALAMSSTFAGNLTILGSIANLIVIEGARRRGHAVTFWEYTRVGVPLSLITIVIGAWWLT
jgi:Na+/H+ antiporter NhaD/arsenite permease-like protein